jgi:hypothetical protein
VDLFTKLTPERFVETARRAIEEIGTRPGVLRECAATAEDARTRSKKTSKPLTPPPRPPEADAVVYAVASGTLWAAVETVRGLIEETISDVGMWASLFHVLRRGGRVLHSEGQVRDEISRVFGNILEQAGARSKAPEIRARVSKVVILRWAIQVAAVSSPGFDWRAYMREQLLLSGGSTTGVDVDAGVSLAFERAALFGEHGLAGTLRKYEPYGGDVPIPLAPLEDDGGPRDKVLQAFMRAWESTSTSTRLWLLVRLWAESTRFAAGALVQPNSSAIDDDPGDGTATLKNSKR